MKASNVLPTATWTTLAVCTALLVQRDSRSENAALDEISNAKVASKQKDRFTTSDLKLQLSDDFNKNYGPPDHFDLTRWHKWEGEARTEKGRGLLMTTSGKEVGMAGIITRKRQFNPGLAGSNGAEVTFVGFNDRGAPLKAPVKTVTTRLVQAPCLTLGSVRGQMGHGGENSRAVPVHLDLIRPNGLFVYLVRGLVPEDFKKYPMDAYTPGGPEVANPTEQRENHEQMVERGEVFVSGSTLSLRHKAYRSEEKIQEFLGRSRRWGLHLTDDANTVFWTLDGEVMDRVDITGYFSSSPESVRDGAWLSISGVGVGDWKIDDVAIYANP